MGLWKLPDLRTRKRPRAHRSLDAGKRPPAPTATTGRGGQTIHESTQADALGLTEHSTDGYRRFAPTACQPVLTFAGTGAHDQRNTQRAHAV